MSETVGKVLNVTQYPAYLADFLSRILGPFVEKASSATLGYIYGDVLLNYTVVLLFMVSLILITCTDQFGMTAPARTFLVKLHFLFVKAVRCIATIGLFFLGKAIGSSSSFGDGLRFAAPIVTAGFSLVFVQRMLELIAMVVPTQQYFDIPLTAGASTITQVTGTCRMTDAQCNASNPIPWIHGSNWGVTLMAVIRDYLNAVTQPCLDSLVGIHRAYGDDLTAAMVDGMTTQNLANANSVPQKLRFLWQFHDVNYTQGAAAYPSSTKNDQSTPGAALTGAGSFNGVWHTSPLFVGVVVGLLK